MNFFLSSYKRAPICDYFLARIRLSDDNLQDDLDYGLNLVVINSENQAVTFYPWGKKYQIADSE